MAVLQTPKQSQNYYAEKYIPFFTIKNDGWAVAARKGLKRRMTKHFKPSVAELNFEPTVSDELLSAKLLTSAPRHILQAGTWKGHCKLSVSFPSGGSLLTTCESGREKPESKKLWSVQRKCKTGRPHGGEAGGWRSHQRKLSLLKFQPEKKKKRESVRVSLYCIDCIDCCDCVEVGEAGGVLLFVVYACVLMTADQNAMHH